MADDHAPALEGMSAVLAPHYEVAGTAADGRALVEAAVHLKPDLIITDITMPHLSGINAEFITSQIGHGVKGFHEYHFSTFS